MVRGPEKRFRFGAIEVCIWSNVTKEGRTMKSISTQRSYTQDDGQTWKTTNNYRPSDVGMLIALLLKALDYIAEPKQISEEKGEEIPAPPEVEEEGEEKIPF